MVSVTKSCASTASPAGALPLAARAEKAGSTSRISSTALKASSQRGPEPATPPTCTRIISARLACSPMMTAIRWAVMTTTPSAWRSHEAARPMSRPRSTRDTSGTPTVEPTTCWGELTYTRSCGLRRRIRLGMGGACTRIRGTTRSIMWIRMVKSSRRCGMLRMWQWALIASSTT